MLETLLSKLSLIDYKYEKIREATECDFNIFSLLRSESDEVALHSRFIGELLNPKGSHNKGALFQELLLKQLALNSEMFLGEFTLEVERSMGKYGRIDLLLVGEHDVIVIENKIYAQDQPKQMERYSQAIGENYGSKAHHLYYLTLSGELPSVESLGNLEAGSVQCISYSIVIKEWIDSCARTVYDSPLLRETIIQYKKLIEKLTGQTLTETHKMEITDLLLEGKNFKYALQIEEVVKDVKAELQKTVWIGLRDSLSKHGYYFNFVNHLFDEVGMDVCKGFYQANNRSRYHGLEQRVLTFGEYGVHLYLEVEDRFYYGFTVSKNNQRGLYKDELLSAVPKLDNHLKKLIGNNAESKWWLGWKYSDDKINFRNFNEENSAKLADAVYRQNWIDSVTKDIVNLIKQCNADCNALAR
ncbi:hypothetical protein BEL05_05035 [Shewanella colwelliana]|uniref:PD-(D/E)XK nuclease superfamily protein n=1 Tax=Shewanella colwelliana TaxID=23 RepID=A0A1E5IQW1_SHECO|nr:PD-(D/E)XK nuclease family protein [Shewanella colwelliana]OEG72343.1 hypothetical protein BEL05_05035 [Shewanella colwelliana]